MGKKHTSKKRKSSGVKRELQRQHAAPQTDSQMASPSTSTKQEAVPSARQSSKTQSRGASAPQHDSLDSAARSLKGDLLKVAGFSVFVAISYAAISYVFQQVDVTAYLNTIL